MVKEIKARVTTRDADKPQAAWSRVRAFRGRRFPLMENYSTEIEPLREWLQELSELGALKLNSVDEAFSLCLRAVKSYVFVRGRGAYKGYPVASKRVSAPALPQSISEAPESQQNIHNQREGPETRTIQSAPSSQCARCEAAAREGNAAGASNTEEAMNASQQGSDEEARELDPFAQQTSDLSELVYDDNAFMMVRRLFDPAADPKFEMICGPYVHTGKKKRGSRAVHQGDTHLRTLEMFQNQGYRAT